ncbi:MAG: hypothetical protein PHE56_06565, partial [Bacteroidales bacterium]|nr:hypothetical protein [Bacteroidales bacterium]
KTNMGYASFNLVLKILGFQKQALSTNAQTLNKLQITNQCRLVKAFNNRFIVKNHPSIKC